MVSSQDFRMISKIAVLPNSISGSLENKAHPCRPDPAVGGPGSVGELEQKVRRFGTYWSMLEL